ncbi:hypothetical protein JCM16163A_32630 [Paenibacillus sp. YK5]
MKRPMKKLMSGVCIASLLVSAAPIPAAWAADAPPAVTAVQPGSGSAVLQDGKYTINYMVKKFGTEQKSVMQDYVVTPGTLTVVDGKQYFTMTIKQSKETTAFKTEINGSLKDTVVVGTNEEKNTRDVQFEVEDLSKKVKAWVKIEWAELNYFHDYYVDISIDKDSARKISGSAEPAGNADSAADGDTVQEDRGQPASDDPSKPVEAPKPSFSDIHNHWAKEFIEQAAESGIANGYEDGKFNPDGEISRAEFTVLIGRALKLEGKKAELNYTDDDQIPDWAKAHLEQAVGASIISGYEDRTFRPDRSITRSEIAVMLVRALGLQPETSQKLSFADEGQIPEWAYPYVAATTQKSIMNIRDNNHFAPNDNATRAEAVTSILLLLKYKK